MYIWPCSLEDFAAKFTSSTSFRRLRRTGGGPRDSAPSPPRLCGGADERLRAEVGLLPIRVGNRSRPGFARDRKRHARRAVRRERLREIHAPQGARCTVLSGFRRGPISWRADRAGTV